jgi:hypothetical protein
LRLIEIKAIPNGDGSYMLVHEYLTEKKRESRSIVITEASNAPIIDTAIYSAKARQPSIVRMHMDGDEIVLRIRKNGTIIAQMVNGKPLNHLTQRTGQGRHKLK